MVWIRGIVFLASCSGGLLTYSVFWQAPTIRAEVAKEVARIDIAGQKMTDRIDYHEQGIYDLKRRVTILEGR
jgi:hypothetical protein